MLQFRFKNSQFLREREAAAERKLLNRQKSELFVSGYSLFSGASSEMAFHILECFSLLFFMQLITSF